MIARCAFLWGGAFLRGCVILCLVQQARLDVEYSTPYNRPKQVKKKNVLKGVAGIGVRNGALGRLSGLLHDYRCLCDRIELSCLVQVNNQKRRKLVEQVTRLTDQLHEAWKERDDARKTTVQLNEHHRTTKQAMAVKVYHLKTNSTYLRDAVAASHARVIERDDKLGLLREQVGILVMLDR